MVPGDHLVPGEAVTGIGLGFLCVLLGLLGSRLLGLLGMASLLLDLRVPVLYKGDVPCNGAGELLVVRPAGRTLGLPRLFFSLAFPSALTLGT